MSLATSNSSPKSSHPSKNPSKFPILFTDRPGDPLFVAISLRAAVLLEPLGPQHLPSLDAVNPFGWGTINDKNSYENNMENITPVM